MRHTIVTRAQAPKGESRPRPTYTVSATSAAINMIDGTTVMRCTTPGPVNQACLDGPWKMKYQIAPRSAPRAPWKRRKKSSARGTSAYTGSTNTANPIAAPAITRIACRRSRRYQEPAASIGTKSAGKSFAAAPAPRSRPPVSARPFSHCRSPIVAGATASRSQFCRPCTSNGGASAQRHVRRPSRRHSIHVVTAARAVSTTMFARKGSRNPCANGACATYITSPISGGYSRSREKYGGCARSM
jgi:hypothetical protein